MIITFDSPVNVILRPQNIIPQLSEDLSSMEIIEMMDSPTVKRVTARIKGTSPSKYSKLITLWEGDEYDNIGQWTDTDVANRIREIYSSGI